MATRSGRAVLRGLRMRVAVPGGSGPDRESRGDQRSGQQGPPLARTGPCPVRATGWRRLDHRESRWDLHPIDLLEISHAGLTHVRAYLAFFAERGHRVRWVAFGGEPADAPPGVEVVPLAPAWPGRGISWRKLARVGAFLELRDLVARLAPDVVHAHFLSSAGLLAALGGVGRLAVTVHGSDLMGSPRWVRGRIARFVAGRSALLNPVSHELEDALLACGIPESKLLRVSMGVELDRFPFRPRNDIANVPRLLCTRHLEEVYDPATVLGALEILRAAGRHVHLTFAAGGSLGTGLEQRIQDGGLAESVELLGGYDPDALGPLMAGSDVYVSASHRDGTSVSLLEAMAAGLYPVVSDIPANRPWVRHGRGGQLFQPGSSSDLAGAIAGALDDPDRPGVLLGNRALVEEQGDRAGGFTRLEARLEQIAGRGPGPGNDSPPLP